LPAGPEPEPVTTSRATVIEAIASPDAEHARAWMTALRGKEPPAEALAVLNRTLFAYRVASASAQVHEVGAEQALVVRAGFGVGDEVADGHWTDAIELARPGGPRPPARRRDAALRPQERLAALLGGHDRPLACEELALRSRADLDQGRVREALLGLDAALRAALVELARDPGRADLAERLAELQALGPEVSAAAGSAMGSSTAPDEPEIAGRALGRLEAALRARSAAGVGPAA
jgi:hypothetical protein